VSSIHSLRIFDLRGFGRIATRSYILFFSYSRYPRASLSSGTSAISLVDNIAGDALSGWKMNVWFLEVRFPRPNDCSSSFLYSWVLVRPVC
jgi:hypothetical protein